MADMDAARLVVSLEAKIDQFEKALAKATGSADKYTGLIDRKFKRANVNVARGMSETAVAAANTAKMGKILADGMSQGAKATEEVGHAAGLATGQSQALFHAMRSGAESIAMGIPPSMVLTQQLNHLTYAASGPGGLTGAFKQVAKFIGGIFTPIRLAIGGVAGLAGAAIYAATSFTDAQSKIDLALSGIGKASGVTVDGINRIAETVSSAGEVSVSEARDIATAIASTGKASEEATGKATMLAKAYSLVAGTDLKGAADELAVAFADPAKGVDLLNAKLGAFNDAETQAIKLMATAGDRLGAQRAMAAGLQASLEGVTAKTTAWAHAWDLVANKASGYFDIIGKNVTRALGGASLQEQIEAAKAELAQVQDIIKGGGLQGFAANGGVDRMQAEIARLEALRDAEKAKSDRTSRNDASLDFSSFVRGLDPTVTQLDTIDAQIAHIKKGLSDPSLTISATTREGAEKLLATLEAQNAATRTYIELARQRYGVASAALGQEIMQADLDIKAMRARTPEQKAYIAQLQAEMAARQQGASAAEVAARGMIASNKSLQQSYQELADTSLEMSKSFASTFAQDLLDGKSAAESLGDALDNLSKKLLEMATNRLVEAALGPLFDGLAGGLATGGASGGLLGGAIIPGILHDGGVAGRDGYGHGRSVSPSAFRGARRYHKGGIAGLKPDEVPAILQKGEMVIPRVASAARSSGQSQDSGLTLNFAPVINMQGATEGAVDKAQTDMIPKLRKMVQAEIANTFDRKARFSRSGI